MASVTALGSWAAQDEEVVHVSPHSCESSGGPLRWVYCLAQVGPQQVHREAAARRDAAGALPAVGHRPGDPGMFGGSVHIQAQDEQRVGELECLRTFVQLCVYHAVVALRAV